MQFDYEAVPFRFSPGSTIDKIIREHNHPNMNADVVQLLRQEFDRINQDKLPPKMEQEILVPVLRPFVGKYENRPRST